MLIKVHTTLNLNNFELKLLPLKMLSNILQGAIYDTYSISHIPIKLNIIKTSKKKINKTKLAQNVENGSQIIEFFFSLASRA